MATISIEAAFINALSDYANRHVGTEADLDEELEAASVEEAIEEIALSRAIHEGLETKPATRDEIFHVLESAQ